MLESDRVGDTLAVGFLSSYVFDGHPLRTAIWLRSRIAARSTCTQRATSSSRITPALLEA